MFLSFSSLPFSLPSFPFPPETPDTQAKNYMKEHHPSYRHNIYSCEKKSLKKFRLFQAFLFTTAKTNFLGLRQIDFFLLGINFCDFEKVPSTQYPALIDIFKQYYGMYTLCKISICSLIYLFVSEWKRQVVIEQTWFLYFWLVNLSQRIFTPE